MGQWLSLVLACMTAMGGPLLSDWELTNLVSSTVEFFQGHNDVSIGRSTNHTVVTVVATRERLGATLEMPDAPSADAPSDSIIDCGPTPRRGAENCIRTIRRALALLPRRPETIEVLDPDRLTPDLEGSLQHVDGFAVPGRRVVYLNRRGQVLEHALRRAGVWDCVLATVVWHKMAHIDGAQEPEAQRREEQLWLQFILSGKVDSGRGLAYLSLLRKRRE
jgi:hypothetical protein